MAERSLEEMLARAERLCGETRVAAARTRAASRASARFLCETGHSKIIRRRGESWDAFIDRYAENVVHNARRELGGE